MIGCIVWFAGMGLAVHFAINGQWLEAIVTFVITAFLVSITPQGEERYERLDR